MHIWLLLLFENILKKTCLNLDMNDTVLRRYPKIHTFSSDVSLFMILFKLNKKFITSVHCSTYCVPMHHACINDFEEVIWNSVNMNMSTCLFMMKTFGFYLRTQCKLLFEKAQYLRKFAIHATKIHSYTRSGVSLGSVLSPPIKSTSMYPFVFVISFFDC